MTIQQISGSSPQRMLFSEDVQWVLAQEGDAQAVVQDAEEVLRKEDSSPSCLDKIRSVVSKIKQSSEKRQRNKTPHRQKNLPSDLEASSQSDQGFKSRKNVSRSLSFLKPSADRKEDVEILDENREGIPLTYRHSMLEISTNSNSLTSAKSCSAQELDSVSVSLKTIENSYRVFQEEKVLNMVSLKNCIENVENVSRLYSLLLPRLDVATAHVFRMALENARRQIQEMNAKSEVLTRHDLQTVGYFFQAPLESTYIDPKTQEIYVQPDHSNLLAFGGQYCAVGEYSGIGLSIQVSLMGRVCDILYLKKQKDQVDYEFPHGFFYSIVPSFIWQDHYSSVKERISKQEGQQSRIVEFLKEKIVEWEYADFAIFEYRGLIRNGLSEKHAQENHAIFFYYKKNKGIIL